MSHFIIIKYETRKIGLREAWPRYLQKVCQEWISKEKFFHFVESKIPEATNEEVYHSQVKETERVKFTVEGGFEPDKAS